MSPDVRSHAVTTKHTGTEVEGCFVKFVQIHIAKTHPLKSRRGELFVH
jgi:hypothetical protein